MLRLCVDECAYSRRLRRFLEEEGHAVTAPADVGLLGVDDDVHFAYAREHGLVLLTQNPNDFRQFHGISPDHSGVPIAGEVQVLNQWRY